MIKPRKLSYTSWTLCAVALLYVASIMIMNGSTYRAQELTNLIKNDIAELSRVPNLENYFKKLKETQTIGSDSIAHVWAHFVRANIQTQPSGQFKLELLYISQTEDGLKAIVQYHFIDLKSGDSVEEFARYYDLKAIYD